MCIRDRPYADSPSWSVSWFFVAWMLVGQSFLINFFLEVLFMEFEKAREEEEAQSGVKCNKEQKMWLDLQRLVVKSEPDFDIYRPPDSWFKRQLYIFERSPQFEAFITLCIIVNVVVMAMSYEGSSSGYDAWLAQINLYLSLIFLIEATLKLIAEGLGQYFKASWNRLDFFIVLCSTADIAIDILQYEYPFLASVGQKPIRIIRVLRVARFFRLIRKVPNLKRFLDTLAYTLPAMLNVIFLVFLILFIFSVLAVFLFQDITTGDQLDPVFLNFKNFGNALYTLLRCSTGENWHIFMFDTMRTAEDDCTAGSTCGNTANVIFWIFFIFIVRYVFLNLFVLVVTEQFETYGFNSADNPLRLFSEFLDCFKKTWIIYAEKFDGKMINQSHLLQFFTKLKQPLGFPIGTNSMIIAREIQKMEINADSDGRVYFHEVLFACIKRMISPVALAAGDEATKIHVIKTERLNRAILRRLAKNVTRRTQDQTRQRRTRMWFQDIRRE
eukprot:TRINITY_DN5916_c0_g1_i3.p1 TRINITY_DN5916_c0_g1~~TRINITY_DN5916_c0_g1_i3.p1  ORF type:complete len:514 (-),score=87.56 TRINITY_DN5916_c0_g1_i3:676-2169(-)